MQQFRTTQIDFDVHKAIETERRGFAETDNDVLRRLLGLPESVAPEGASDTSISGASGAWSRDGAILPNGTLMRMTYNGQLVEGQIVDGFIIANGKKFTTPSGAAMDNVRTKSGKKTSLDGWAYWNVKRPDDEDYISLSSLRKK